jgi:hypothetical protein
MSLWFKSDKQDEISLIKEGKGREATPERIIGLSVELLTEARKGAREWRRPHP